MKTSFALASMTGTLLLGLALGYFFRPQPLDCSNCPPPTNNNYSAQNQDVAHKNSNNYRKAMGYCPTATNNFDKHGYFEITNDAVLCLNTAVNDIIQSSGSNPPRRFRCIFGMTSEADANAKLLVVGLDNTSKLENLNLIKQIDLGLPCPYLCDAPLSQIIFGANGNQACN